jgi:Domain of unknown function DUF29
MDKRLEEDRPQAVASRDDDFNAWLLNQADALRNRHYTIDWDGLAEELEAMARKDRTELRSRLQNLLSHLLKWTYGQAAAAKVGSQRLTNPVTESTISSRNRQVSRTS